MNLQVEIEKEEDNRWLAEIPALPGVLAYGETQQEAIARAKALALRVFAFHDNEEIGPRMLARVAKHTGLTPMIYKSSCSRAKCIAASRVETPRLL